MSKLTIFDDGIKRANVTIINGKALIFAKSSRAWRETYMLITSRFTRANKKNGKWVEVTMKDDDFLEHVAELAQSYNYSTEII